MILKAALGLELAVAVATTATGLDGTAEKFILYGGAATALAVLWRMVIRPAGAMARHAARIVKRTSDAVEALETLPAWRREHDQRLVDHNERLADLEGELGLAVNNIAAIRRKLGVSDEDVRHDPPLPRRGRDTDLLED